jgi:hypothetical protein
MSDVSSRYENLEAQTNQNRIEFLRKEAAMCLTLIGMAETEQALNEDEAAARSLEHAKEGYATMLRFLSDPKHTKHIAAPERQELDKALEGIKGKLEICDRDRIGRHAADR